MKSKQTSKISEKVEMLARMRQNPRVTHIRVAAPEDCRYGLSLQGVYEKDNVPIIPRKECSRPNGCICTYEPILNTIYP